MENTGPSSFRTAVVLPWSASLLPSTSWRLGWLLAALVLLGTLPLRVEAGPPLKPAPTGQPDARAKAEAEAAALVEVLSRTQDLQERRKLVRQLIRYPEPKVVRYLLGLLVSWGDDPGLLQELQWALTAMSGALLEPLQEALDEGLVQSDLAVGLLTRLSRQEPRLLLPALTGKHPRMTRFAALALAAGGHQKRLEVLQEGFATGGEETRLAVLEAVCASHPGPICEGLLMQAMEGESRTMRILAATLAGEGGYVALAPACMAMLHDSDPLAVRNALEALSRLGAAGAEKDLAILFEASPDDIKEQILRAMARTASPESFRFLRETGERLSFHSRLGTLARRLFRESAQRVVLRGGGDEVVPVEAVVVAPPSGGYFLVLYNAEGFRVAVPGVLGVRCGGGGERRAPVSAGDFPSDGGLVLTEQCGSKVPRVRWYSSNGTALDASYRSRQEPARE